MGLDRPSAKLLLAANSRGVDFSSVAMIGRQGLHCDEPSLADLFKAFSVAESARTVIRDSKGYAERFFSCLGAEQVVSVDASDYEGATIVHDMNLAVDASLKDRFSVVYDGGTLEHVFNYPQAIKNCMEMVRVGGHFVQVTTGNNFLGHGFYQYSPELLFRVFSKENGFSVRGLYIHEVVPNGRWFKVKDPKAVEGRVELCNFCPTYVVVVARRELKTDIFAQIPQQSDYQVAWKDKDSSGAAIKAAQRLWRQTKRALRALVGLWDEEIYRKDHYTRVEDADFLPGGRFLTD